MMMQRREHSLRRPLTLLFAALFGLLAGACDDPVDIPNAPATIPAVGNIDGPVEGCDDQIMTQTQALDGGTDGGTDAGTDADIGADVGLDAGADADTGADADAGADVGLDAGADAGEADAGAADAGAADAGNADAGTVDAGADTGAGVDAGVGTDAGAFEPRPVRITRDGNALVIPYLLRDREGDDQRIKVELCEWDGSEAVSCGVAVQSAGGDGTSFVPTTPAGTCILHVFYWDVGCGRFVATDNGGTPQKVFIDGVDQALVAQVSVIGSEEEPTQTEPFTLEGIGFESVPECN
jgi:hypothetical protein